MTEGRHPSTVRHAMSEIRARLKSGLDRRGLLWLRTSFRVVSVLLADARPKPDAELRIALDRVGLRWVLRRLLARSSELRERGVTGVVYRRGAWFHRYGSTYVHT